MSRHILLAVAFVVGAAGLGYEEVVRTQSGNAPTPPWVGLPVSGTGLMVWIQGTPSDLSKYVDMAGKVWEAFPAFFPYPLDDVPGLAGQAGTFNSREINPDTRIDIYVIDREAQDPRLGNCQDCALGTNAGWAREDPATLKARMGSGYVLLNRNLSDADAIETMAHELAHVAQRRFDWDERKGGEVWVQESTAQWVAYKVMLAIGSSRAWDYRLLDPRGPALFAPGLNPPLFNNLDRPLHRTGNNYSGFLFFYYASEKLGDDIVTRVWQQASAPGPQGIDAVDQVIKFAEHFPGFTVRNLNETYLPGRYKDTDPTFPDPLLPDPIYEMPSGLGTWDLNRPVENLSAQYYRFRWRDAKVRRVTLRNFHFDVPDAHVWAIKRIGTEWKEPEDWSRQATPTLCRDLPSEHVTELVLVVSNSHLRFPLSRLAPNEPSPQMLVEDVGCDVIEGWAQSTLRLRDDRQDVTYTSSRATLTFKPRTIQDQPGNVEYDLLPTSVTWTVSGTEDDCTVEGQTVVTIPAFLDQPLDPTRPAYGYLNVVGVDGGDFHSVKVSAVNPAATYTKTCPGSPPRITQEPFRSAWLLHVLTQMNTHTGSAVAFSGRQTFDPDRFQDNLPQAARDLLTGTASPVPSPPLAGVPAPAPPGAGSLPGTGIGVPGGAFGNVPTIDPQVIEEAMRKARAALQQAELRAGRVVYTFEWELKPATGAAPPP